MKKLIFSVLAVAAMASCSKSELTERPVTGDAFIGVKSEVLSVKQATKAPFEGITATDSLVARVIASTVSGNFDPNNTTANWHDANMVFIQGSDTTPVGYNPSRAYPTDGSSVFLCGLYPASTTDWKSFSFSTSPSAETTAKYTFDGKTDVMLAAQVETKKSEVLATPAVYKKLVFNHMLTKLVVCAKAKTAAAISDFGGITEIRLSKAGSSLPFTTMEATLSTGTADPSSAFSVADSMDFYTIDNTTTPATPVATDSLFQGKKVALKVVDGTIVTDAPRIGYSMVAPIIATGSDDYELLVKTEKNPKGFPVKVNLKKPGNTAFTGSTQGKAFVITLEFESTPIEALGQVTDWDEIVLPGDITIK
ncbi:MAG: fimbrillin family protein [Alistipes sp.]|nr:fimbrillin family protein [Alistipes sp.]